MKMRRRYGTPAQKRKPMNLYKRFHKNSRVQQLEDEIKDLKWKCKVLLDMVEKLTRENEKCGE